MEMTHAMVKKYGEANMKALANYKAKFLGENKLDISKLESPKDIPIGTILTQYWLNSMTYYMVTRTTNKSVEFVEILDTQIDFDPDGGGTGTRYCMPDLVRTKKEQDTYKAFVKRTGLDIFNLKRNAEWPQEWFHNLSKKDKDEYFSFHNFNGCSKKILKHVKPAKNGGFYIPGPHTGFMCCTMSLWDGTPDREYYGD